MQINKTTDKQAIVIDPEAESKKTLLDNMSEGFAYCKMVYNSQKNPVNFIFIQTNKIFEKFLGTETSILHQLATECTPNMIKDHPEILEKCNEAILKQKSQRFEINLEYTKIWLSILVYSTQLGYFTLLCEDITNLKKSEERNKKYENANLLKKINEKDNLIDSDFILRDKRLAAIGELAGMVGHDLRNPLSGIKNAAYVIRKRQPNLIESSIQMLNKIDAAIDYSNKIVNDLLDFSRELNLECEECSPKTLMDYVLLQLKIPKNVKLIDHTEYTPLIWVDIAKIQRIFINLIKNAFDAMPHGGTLEIVSRQSDENIQFIFSDTGIGMTDEIKSKIFNPLFTTKAQGMGFGLSICQRIVMAHQGTIEVTSTMGKGSTFTITLPLSQGY
jgi:signal transduction histidine kinase